MSLYRKYLFANGKGGVFTKIRLRQPDGVWRQGHDLVLMHMDKVKLVDIAGDPVNGANHLDWHCANTPAIIKFSRMSPQRMRHNLMAEANPDKRFASGENFSDKCHQSGDKGGIIIDPIG